MRVFSKKRGEMKTAIKAILVFLVLMLGVSSAPAQAATLPPNFDPSALTDLQNELNGFGTDPAKQISNALLDKAGVEQDGNDLPPELWTVRKAVKTAPGGLSWFQREDVLPVNLRSRRFVC
jgi:hypothetical protein